MNGSHDVGEAVFRAQGPYPNIENTQKWLENERKITKN
jgi:hypothetical protein